MIYRLAAVAVGIWLMAAPAVLGYGGSAADNDRTTGPIIGCLAFVAIWPVVRTLRWATLPFGAWLLVAPLVLGYDDGLASVNSVVCGVLTMAAALFGGGVSRSFGGGWRSLVRDPC